MANPDKKEFSSRITDWPEDERPRERLIKNGAHSVSSAELIAILLGQGSVGHNALDTAKNLLREFKSLEGLANASLVELQKIPGIGPAKAVTLLASFQLYRNMQSEMAGKDIVTFKVPGEIAKLYMPIMSHLKTECFYVILLDTAMRKIADFEITKGLLNKSLVHPREVFSPAIRFNAKGIVVLHNHPSGTCQPSNSDIKITKQLRSSGDLLGIPLYDHIIIAEEKYYSFTENGLLDY